MREWLTHRLLRLLDLVTWQRHQDTPSIEIPLNFKGMDTTTSCQKGTIVSVSRHRWPRVVLPSGLIASKLSTTLIRRRNRKRSKVSFSCSPKRMEMDSEDRPPESFKVFVKAANRWRATSKDLPRAVSEGDLSNPTHHLMVLSSSLEHHRQHGRQPGQL